MKALLKNLFVVVFCFSVIACSKSVETGNTKEPPPPPAQPAPVFVEYLIKKGNQFTELNPYTQVNISEMKFMVRFDSSAIYQTIDPINQYDVNKLYGFSDNNANHHQFSARFGWRWLNNELHVLGYIYNNGNMSFQEIGTVRVGQNNACSIKVDGDKYIFTLNGTTLSMPRKSTASTAIGYKLHPYFGGTEMAPHDMRIWIKDL